MAVQVDEPGGDDLAGRVDPLPDVLGRWLRARRGGGCRPSTTAIVPGRPGAPVPSTMVPPLIRRSACSVTWRPPVVPARPVEAPPADPRALDHVGVRPEDEPAHEVTRVVVGRGTRKGGGERWVDGDQVGLLARLERPDRRVQAECLRARQRPHPQPVERVEDRALLARERAAGHQRIRADTHDREDRGLRPAGDVRPEPDREAGLEVPRERHHAGTDEQVRGRAMGDPRPRLDAAARAPDPTGGWRGPARSAARARRHGRRRPRSRVPRGRAAATSAISPGSSETCVCHQVPVSRASVADSRSISAEHETANRGVTAYPRRPSSAPCQRSIRSADSRSERSRIVDGSMIGSYVPRSIITLPRIARMPCRSAAAKTRVHRRGVDGAVAEDRRRAGGRERLEDRRARVVRRPRDPTTSARSGR